MTRHIRVPIPAAIVAMLTLAGCGGPEAGQPEPDVGPTYATLSELVLRSDVVAETRVLAVRRGPLVDRDPSRWARLLDVEVLDAVKGPGRGARITFDDGRIALGADGSSTLTTRSDPPSKDGDRLVVGLRATGQRPGVRRSLTGLYPYSDDSIFVVNGNQIEDTPDARPVVAEAQGLTRAELLAELRDLAE